jgi:hypothetical protein
MSTVNRVTMSLSGLLDPAKLKHVDPSQRVGDNIPSPRQESTASGFNTSMLKTGQILASVKAKIKTDTTAAHVLSMLISEEYPLDNISNNEKKAFAQRVLNDQLKEIYKKQLKDSISSDLEDEKQIMEKLEMENQNVPTAFKFPEKELEAIADEILDDRGFA